LVAADNMMTGHGFDLSKTLIFCEGCVEGKLHQMIFPNTVKHATRKFLVTTIVISAGSELTNLFVA